MATYYVYSGAGGINDGSTFANAFTDPASAIAVASTNGDVIKVHYTHQDPVGDKNYVVLADISIISIDGNNSDAPTPMGTSGEFGNSTGTGYGCTVAGAFKVYMYGITLATASSSTETIAVGNSDGSDFTLEECMINCQNTSTSTTFLFGISAANNGFIHLKNFTMRFGNASQAFRPRVPLLWEGGSVDSGGSVPTSLFHLGAGDPTWQEVIGVDLSHCTGTLVSDATETCTSTKFVQCKLGVTVDEASDILATQTVLNRGSAEVWLHDCSSGDVHGIFAHVNALGATISNTSITFTGTAASQSWKVVGTAAATRYSPYYTPWIDRYAAAGSLLAYMEILRDGSATAYTNAEVWLEGSSKTTSGSTRAVFLTDRATVLAAGSDQDAGSGTGSWSGESGTAWSGSLGFLTLSPVEDGYIRCRVAVGGAFTVYVDPVIRS